MERFLTNSIKTGLLVIAFIVPILYWNSTMYPFITLKTVVFQSIVEILAAFWLTLIIFYKEYRPRMTPLTIALLFYLAILLISAFFGVNFWKSFWSTQARLTGIFLIIHLAALFLILKTTVFKEKFWKWLWLGGLTTSFIGVATGFVEKFFAHNLFSSLDSGRASSLFGNPTFLAGYLLMNVFSGLMIFSLAKGRWSRATVMALTLIAGLGILLTQTIGDFGALLAGIYFLIIYLIFFLKNKSHYRRWFYFLLTAIIVITIFGGIFLVTRESSVWRFVPGLSRIATVDFEATIQNRFIAWSAGWQAFKEKPFFGYGWENFNVAFNKYYNPVLLSHHFTETYWDKPHNVLLEYLYTTGAVGLLGYLSLMGTAFYEGWRLRKRFPQVIFLMAGLAAYLIQNLVAFDTIGVYLMLFMYLAFIDWQYGTMNKELGIRNNEL